MMISTRGRYALRVLIDLAEHEGDGYIPMNEIADRQGISLKYLEQIVPALAKNGFIEGVHGKGGGYRLVKATQDCRVGDVLRLTEEILHRLPALNAVRNRVSEPMRAEPIRCGRNFIGLSTIISTE